MLVHAAFSYTRQSMGRQHFVKESNKGHPIGQTAEYQAHSQLGHTVIENLPYGMARRAKLRADTGRFAMQYGRFGNGVWHRKHLCKTGDETDGMRIVCLSRLSMCFRRVPAPCRPLCSVLVTLRLQQRQRPICTA
jgi:hypothetical protein